MIRTKAKLLVGKKIEMICFAQYSLYIHIEDGIVITVESGIEHVHNGTRNVLQFSSPVSQTTLLEILETSITSATVEPNGDLLLTTSGGDKLYIFKEPQYESYRLKINGEELIG